MSNTIVNSRDNGLGMPKRQRGPKVIQPSVNLVSFQVIGQDGGMIVVECVLHIGGVAGHNVRFVGPLQAVTSDEVAEPQGPITVTLPNLEKSE